VNPVFAVQKPSLRARVLSEKKMPIPDATSFSETLSLNAGIRYIMQEEK
jgi:hypothetical protein